MKHDKLMKYPKRFCVDCDAAQFVYVVHHTKAAVYHCKVCGGEIHRVGDGLNKAQPKRVRGGIDVNSLSSDGIDGKSSDVLACENPDVLSDEHATWGARNPEDEFERREQLRLFQAALSGLTERQLQIVKAMDRHKNQAEVAASLGIDRGTVAATLTQIKRKLIKTLNISGGEGIQGKGTL